MSFKFAHGSVIGRDHYLLKKNNQDSYAMHTEDGITVAVVTDGCGDPSSPDSEVGAKLGAKIVARSVAYRAIVANRANGLISWNYAKEDICHDLYSIVNHVDIVENRVDLVRSTFLFTCVGVLITPMSATFFTIGDGLIVINGQRIDVPSYPENMPPYISYNLIPESLRNTDRSYTDFHIRALMSTERLESFVIGTDGAIALIEKEEDISHKIGSYKFSQLYLSDPVYDNPEFLNLHLNAINKDKIKIDYIGGKVDKNNGLLNDDTTIIVGKRA